MTNRKKIVNCRGETNYQALRKMADRIDRGQTVGLSKHDELRLLRVVHELEQTRYALELAEIEAEVKNEQLQTISRELEASKKDFWAVAENIPTAFIVLDKRGIVKRANSHARQMLVGDIKPLIGLEFSRFVAPEDFGTYLKQIKTGRYSKNNPSSFELRIRDHAGRLLHTYGQVSAGFDAEGARLQWNLAFFDVSEQKRLEEALRTSRQHLALATEAGKIGIWIVDLKTGRSHWNAQLYRMLGLEPREGPEDKNAFFEFIHPDDRRGLFQNLQTVLRIKETVDTEFRIIRSDNGQIRWLKSRGAIVRDAHGHPYRLEGVNYDITDRKQAEERENFTNLELDKQLVHSRQLNEELSQFYYAVTHDLKAPLRAIANYVNFLHEDLADTLTGDQKKYLEGLKGAVIRGNALIHDLLNFSRIGQVAPVTIKIDVPGLIQRIGSLLHLPPDVEMDVQPQWPDIWTDYNLMNQILQNLISNAVKFSRRNPKRVEIGWQTASDRSIEIFVRDNGIGIAPEYQRQIFKIFRRLHTDKNYEGTGIGLSLVQKAAQNLGGSVRVESVPGEGSTFFVRLPDLVLKGEDNESAPDG